MKKIFDLRCHNHPEREAVAMCKMCKNHFCRECITDYNGKMLCRKCMEEVINGKSVKKTSKINLRSVGSTIFRILILFYFFFFLGKIMILMADFLTFI